jgi:hypothetical protein
VSNAGTGQPFDPTITARPSGLPVGSYQTYLEAQRAVDHLSDQKFPVELVTVVGSDLKMVEKVTGRLTYGRAALGGAASGAWFGLFVGLLFSFFSNDNTFGIILLGLLYGAIFGALFGVVTYALTGGRRDFTSRSQIVASTYDVLCQAQRADEAREILARFGLRG